jgi:hypothetical protein
MKRTSKTKKSKKPAKRKRPAGSASELVVVRGKKAKALGKKVARAVDKVRVRARSIASRIGGTIEGLAHKAADGLARRATFGSGARRRA